MKTALALLVVFLLSGCGTLSLLSGQDASESVVAKLASVAIPDLQAAAADATAHSDEAANMCWTGLIPIVQQIQALLTPPANLPTVPKGVGVFSDIQRIRDAKAYLNSLTLLRNSGQLAQIRQAINLACAALWMDMKASIVDPLGLFSGPLAP
jgi:uncharacterized protein YceK